MLIHLKLKTLCRYKFGNKILDLSPINERNDEQSTTEFLRPSDINLTSKDLGIDVEGLTEEQL